MLVPKLEIRRPENAFITCMVQSQLNNPVQTSKDYLIQQLPALRSEVAGIQPDIVDKVQSIVLGGIRFDRIQLVTELPNGNLFRSHHLATIRKGYIINLIASATFIQGEEEANWILERITFQ